MSSDSVTLQEAIALYFNGSKRKAGTVLAQQELVKFTQWFGGDKRMSDLKPFEIEAYGGRIEGSNQAAGRVQAVKGFLSYAKKKGLVESNLGQHLRVRRSKAKTQRSGDDRPERVTLTAEGHAHLESELEQLKAKRGPIATEIRRAAADKDVRENAPLEAAREQLGLVESRIREIESTLYKAMVRRAATGAEAKVVSVGSRVVLKDVGTGRETKYLVVSAREANPLDSKISDASPVGKALMGRAAGDEIDVETPRGKLRYRIDKVSG